MTYINERSGLGLFIGAVSGYVGLVLTLVNLYPNPIEMQENLFIPAIILSPIITGIAGGIIGYDIKKSENTNQKKNNLENRI